MGAHGHEAAGTSDVVDAVGDVVGGDELKASHLVDGASVGRLSRNALPDFVHLRDRSQRVMSGIDNENKGKSSNEKNVSFCSVI